VVAEVRARAAVTKEQGPATLSAATKEKALVTTASPELDALRLDDRALDGLYEGGLGEDRLAYSAGTVDVLDALGGLDGLDNGDEGPACSAVASDLDIALEGDIDGPACSSVAALDGDTLRELDGGQDDDVVPACSALATDDALGELGSRELDDALMSRADNALPELDGRQDDDMPACSALATDDAMGELGSRGLDDDVRALMSLMSHADALRELDGGQDDGIMLACSALATDAGRRKNKIIDYFKPTGAPRRPRRVVQPPPPPKKQKPITDYLQMTTPVTRSAVRASLARGSKAIQERAKALREDASAGVRTVTDTVLATQSTAVGSLVRKWFHAGWFWGEVVKARMCDDTPWLLIVYHDGDKEEVSDKELHVLISQATRGKLDPYTADRLFRKLLGYYSTEFGFEGDDNSADSEDSAAEEDDECRPLASSSKEKRRRKRGGEGGGEPGQKRQRTVKTRNGKERMGELRDAWAAGGGACCPLICKVTAPHGRRDPVLKTVTVGGMEQPFRLRGRIHDVVQLVAGGFGYVVSYKDNEPLSEFLLDSQINRLKADGAFKWLPSAPSLGDKEEVQEDEEGPQGCKTSPKTSRSPQDRDVYLCDFSTTQGGPLPSIVRVSAGMTIPRAKPGTSLSKEEFSLYLDDLEEIVQRAINQFEREGETMAIRNNWQQWIGVEKSDPRYNFRAVVLLLLSPVLADKILPGLMAELFERFPDAISILGNVNGFAQFMAQGKTPSKGRCNMFNEKTEYIVRTTKKLFAKYSQIQLSDDKEPPKFPPDFDLESYRNIDIVSGTSMETLASCAGVGQKIANLIFNELYGKLAAIPVDVHARRILVTHLGCSSGLSQDELAQHAGELVHQRDYLRLNMIPASISQILEWKENGRVGAIKKELVKACAAVASKHRQVEAMRDLLYFYLRE
jgi:endonuclease III